MIEYAHELGHKGIAFTEHESITSSFDAIEYYDGVKDKPGWEDFKVILGNEIYLCNENVTAENKATNFYPHFILLALNGNGHKGLRELSTKAWTQNCFKHVINRVPTYYSDLEEMLKKYKGDVVGSSACLGSLIARRLLGAKPLENTSEYEDIWQSCIGWIEYMKEIFGDGNFFGARTFVAQGLKIGNNTRVGAGAIVLRNTKDGLLYMGNPAKKVEI